MSSFEHTIDDNAFELAGRKKFVTGSWTTLAGLTGSGGTINTGLRIINFFNATVHSSTGATLANTVGIQLQNGATPPPIQTGAVFIIVPSSATSYGNWIAFGE